MNKNQEREYKKATVCYMCAREFTKEDYKVKDHDHYTGLYSIAAHNSCNIVFHEKYFIPIFFYNLSGYDSHLFIKNIGFDVKELDLIPQSEERYISFLKHIHVDDEVEKKKKYVQLQFLDLLRFMSDLIDSLSQNLTKEQFKETEKYFPDKDFLKKECFHTNT